ncbi:MAG: tyrosine-protein phosphatase [Opitutae bacterium]|nr:tyrosine-protein phosphatase [Opitutae bacterium]
MPMPFTTVAPPGKDSAGRQHAVSGPRRMSGSAIRRIGLIAAFVALAIGGAGCVLMARGVPGSEGLPNFGRVDRTLWRGAQPDAHGLETLHRLGVATIINLRMADDVVPGEEATARRLGIGYVNVPLHGFSGPSDAEVDRVLALIASSPPPVFVHCRHGADRTGVIVACYRMRHDGWPTAQAMAEAEHYGISALQVGMKRYLRTFAARGK